MDIEYKVNNSTLNDIYCHLQAVNQNFVVPLSQRLDIEEYAQKLYSKSIRVEAWHNNDLVGLVAYYYNIQEYRFHISNVSVIKQFEGQGIATRLLHTVINEAERLEVKTIDLLADRIVSNFYIKRGFHVGRLIDYHTNEMILTIHE